MSGILNSLKNLAGANRSGASGEGTAKFSLCPLGGADEGEGGFPQWLHAMRLVARLPAGVPQHFRRKLWLTLAERHLTVRGVDWPAAERACFRGTAHPEDSELGSQIVKDLHRTGCSLFCGTEGRENQAMLRRVLLAYARWNKDVGYCQGFNMLAAIILEVMEKSEGDSLKVMIYLVEAVLPEGYFADDLRGLSADMAAFRDLLRIRLPRLAHHMERLQNASDGGGVEPPLPDVFTMQWFLTLYATWLPRAALLRVWDLVFLDGNEVLLLTALAIWDLLQDRILSARSADEFYSCMGSGVGAVWAAGEELVTRVVALGEAPELPRLRDLHRYHVTPPAPPPPSHAPAQLQPTTMQSVTRRGLKLFYSEDEGDSSDDGNKMALATMNLPRRTDMSSDRLSLDIGALKRQYARLRERQRQAHVILAAACARHAAVGVPTTPTSLTVNHLLLGKSAIVSSRGRRLGPPPGAVPPSRRSETSRKRNTNSENAVNWKEEHQKRSQARRDSIKWKDIKKSKDDERKASLESNEAGDGIIVSESEANEIMNAMRSRSLSESSSYSSRSNSISSTDTSLCDDKGSDIDSEVHSLDENNASLCRLSNNEQLNNISDENISYFKNTSMSSVNTCNDQDDIRLEFNNCENETEDIKQNDKIDNSHHDRSSLGTYGNQRKLDDIFYNHEHNQIDSPVIEKTLRVHNVSSPKSEDQIFNSPLNTNITKMSEITDSSPKSNKISYIARTTTGSLNVSKTFKHNYENSDKFINSDKLSDKPSHATEGSIRSPYYVPDLDLTEKVLSDLDSSPRSPGAESIVISEDEPPIPLKIDKYFENSPDFFGARKIIVGSHDSEDEDFPNRRTQKRMSRLAKKPDSLMLQHNLNEITHKTETKMNIEDSNIYHTKINTEVLDSTYLRDSCIKQLDHCETNEATDNVSVADISRNSSDSLSIVESGRRNSERALQIIQENSKILNRILTKQISAPIKLDSENASHYRSTCSKYSHYDQAIINTKIVESPILKGSASDSLIKIDKYLNSDKEKINKLRRPRPISLDGPTSTALMKSLNFSKPISSSTATKSSSIDEVLENTSDTFGWESRVFYSRYDKNEELKCKSDTDILRLPKSPENLTSYKLDTACVATMDNKNTYNEKECNLFNPCNTVSPYENTSLEQSTSRFDYTSNSSRYNDCVLSKASEICSRTLHRGPKVCENISKADSSVGTDFAFIVTSSMTFSCEPSGGDESPAAPKSNSSDTLCQITSLDQISTPISPKMFPKDTPTPKESVVRLTISPDDTSSQITSLVETETAPSLSFSRSPSSSSYHPFPARPPVRIPKELGVRLGMYSRDSTHSPTK